MEKLFAIFGNEKFYRRCLIVSRVGRLPIDLPNGVEVTIGADNLVTVKGIKGILEKKMPCDIVIKRENNQILVERKNESKQQKQIHGLDIEYSLRGKI